MTTMEKSLVSIIIPAYNQAQYLGKAIQSALGQTYSHLEVLVVDDGSTDDTPGVAQSFNDPRLRYIHQQNRGLSGARNTGIEHSLGEYLTYLDADDLFLPDKLATLVSALQEQPHLGFVAGQAIPIDEHDRQVGAVFASPVPGKPEEWLLGNPLHVGSVLVRREWQERVGRFDETLRSYEDWDMWLRLALDGCRMGWVAQPVAYYRFHRQQMTRIGQQMTQATFAVLDKLFSRSDLPASWLAYKDLAYSNAHLRAAMQAYHHLDYAQAQDHLRTAIRLQPELVENHSQELIKRLNAFALSPKNPEPLGFLENIYSHLPSELGELHRNRAKLLAGNAIQYGFEAYRLERSRAARDYLWQGIRLRPAWLLNRGVLSVLLRTALANNKS
jgi:glycosyltransferase involved in cell wall biosynthesis